MKVFITRPIPEKGIALLKAKGFEIVDSIDSADAMIATLLDRIDSEFIESAPASLKIIANYAVGYDNIDLPAAKERGIFVTNTPDVLTEAVAEHTIGLMLAIARRISEADRYVRAGNWHMAWAWDFMLGGQLKGRTLGILGPGRIGSRVGEITEKALGMK